MSRRMLAAYLPGNSTVELKEIDVPTPGPNQVLIKMKSSGICGSDIKYIYHKHMGSREKRTAYMNVVAGHEPCGQIVGLGPNCRHFKEGDRVVVYHISGCGFCPSCRKGHPISCTDLTLRSAYGWQRDGGHEEFLVADEKDLIHLPDSLSYDDGCFISCGVGTAYEGVLRADVSGSDSVVVVGLGPVGLAALMIAKGRGAKKVIGVDVQASRVEEARRLGLTDAGFVASAETLRQIMELTKGGANVALDCSGAAQGRLLALQSTAVWGRCVYIGEMGDVQFDVSEDLLHQQRSIIGSWVTSLYNMEQCCGDLDDWGYHPHDIVTHRFALADAGKAYAVMAEGKCGKVVISFE
jgi:threonine dehydrogenase-like Zn-dependent dehydrogenase